MSRESAFRGAWSPNKRPYVVVTPDVYVSFQGETSVIGCGDCRRKIPLNDYITGISTEASVDSGTPGTATINLSIPDNDVNDFFVDGQFLVVPMMEIEIYAKGYFLVGGFPQYYKIFWGMVGSVSKDWSSGTTTINISCKDILRWWELTYSTINPGFIDSFGSSAGNFEFWGNQFAGMNPYTIIIALAQESMGDFTLTQGSFMSYLPEHGPESQTVGAYAMDIMAYWQLKFANIWSSLVVYGTSGQAYSFGEEAGTISPVQISAAMFNIEKERNFVNQETTLFRVQPSEIAAYKKELNKAADFEMFQNEQQSKLATAITCRDQAGYEFYCDTTGDIIFKPPFYNLNVLPNKPTSWIQDFEVIDDGVTDSEEGVITHLTSAGNAFGGVFDPGLSDEITTPRTGAYDFHLMRRYGHRRMDYQCEWAGNPRKLFYHLLDYLDRINSKRQNGRVTIPMRPELRMGFPIWFPKYDSFFYIQGISHQYSVGGQATTSLTLTAKRSKFIAPTNIGTIEQSGLIEKSEIGNKKTTGEKRKIPSYTIKFPDRTGASTGQSQTASEGKPVYLRDPKTGKMLGFPNVVMVYRAAYNSKNVNRVMETLGQPPPKPKSTQRSKTRESTDFKHKNVVVNMLKRLQGEERAKIISQIRAHRYEAGMTNAGMYDYAFDVSRSIKELQLVPTESITWGSGTDGGDPTEAATTAEGKVLEAQKKADIEAVKKLRDEAQAVFNGASKAHAKARKDLSILKKKRKTRVEGEVDEELTAAESEVSVKLQAVEDAKTALDQAKLNLVEAQGNRGAFRRFASLNMMIRPVSDEFGFEVIGHYKYGRGSFIDRGQLKINTGDPQRLANELNIQFAPSGGFLTDPSVTGNNDGSSVSFASSFEKMQPEDYVTGASFKHYSSAEDGGPTDVVQTSQNTYTNLVNANVGNSTFVEADAVRRSQTLGELSPSISIPGLDDARNPCSCGLGRSDWLSVLPVDLIKTIVNSKDLVGSIEEQPNRINPEYEERINEINVEIDTAISDKTLEIENEIASIRAENLPELATRSQIEALRTSLSRFISSQDGSRSQRLQQIERPTPSLTTDAANPTDSIFKGSISTESFFSALTQYLSDKFREEYERSNVPREKAYTAQSSGVQRLIPDPVTRRLIPDPVTRRLTPVDNSNPLEGNSSDNFLGDPSDPLFGAASRGDPDALEALQQQANFNFGSTKKAISNLSDAWRSGKSKIRKDANAIKFGSGTVFKATSGSKTDTESGPQTQPDVEALPLSSVIDQKSIEKLKNVSVGSAVLGVPIIIPNDRVTDSRYRTVGPVPPPGYSPTPADVNQLAIFTKKET